MSFLSIVSSASLLFLIQLFCFYKFHSESEKRFHFSFNFSMAAVARSRQINKATGLFCRMSKYPTVLKLMLNTDPRGMKNMKISLKFMSNCSTYLFHFHVCKSSRKVSSKTYICFYGFCFLVKFCFRLELETSINIT